MFRFLRRQLLLLAVLATVVLVVAVVAVANAVVLIGGHGSTGVADAPHAQVALVLGAQVKPDGSLSAMLADRVAVGMVRARKVFQVTSALIVTQNFHLPRAVWLARRAGLEAHGVSADIQGYGHALRFSQVRELFARVKAVEQVVTGADPKFLGPPIPITGDGRASAG